MQKCCKIKIGGRKQNGEYEFVERESKNLYGITPEKRDAARKELERIIKEQNVKPARTVEELYGYSVNDDNGEEIDDFMRLREEWREEDKKLSDERKKHLDLWV